MDHPLNSICILRLSAIGDVSHMIPVVRTMQKFWPTTKLTWIIGKNEASLINDIPNIEFIEFDKSNFIGSCKNIYKKVRHQNFDALLCAQVSLRTNIISALIPASIKLGYDKARSKDLHSFFINQHIAPVTQQHVLDSFFSFIEYFGLHEREMHWGYNIPDDAYEYAKQHLASDQFIIIISPCSSHSLRNWTAERYAEVADYAIQSLNAQVILTGGPSPIEKEMGHNIERLMQTKALNLIGKDSLKKFLALLQLADVIITPDSGPAHLAAGLGTPVIGLYAASNPKRTGPYYSQNICVDRYEEAARAFRNKPASQLKWGTKLEYKGVMDLIDIADVTSKLEEIYANNKQQT